MNLSDFDFDLPEELIATRPVSPRSSARMLVARGGHFADQIVSDLPDILTPQDRLVINTTKVIPARLFGLRKRAPSSGGTGTAKIEVTLLEQDASGAWSALIKPLRKVNMGEIIQFDAGLTAQLVGKQDGQARLMFNLSGNDFDQALDACGAMPLPPYIASKRAADDRDKTDYQTVFATERGSVAAPTASLHFDETLLAALRARGVQFSYVTLHVGAGTFLPVKVDDITTHKMHAEWGAVSQTAAQEINDTKSKGGRVIPVGTTALRLIETAARDTGVIQEWSGDTDIFIYPGFKFNVADALMTNFHLPKSTLVMLVAALMGQEVTQMLYDHAILNRYRFFSYGDSSLLIPQG
jgi:S-adenosylmethionine:tRNA ribosyltransferase-isomerase